MKKLFFIFNFPLLIFNFSFSQPVIQWQKCLGGTGLDWAFSVQQTNDGGYIVAGYTNSNDGDVTGNHGAYDYWVVKLNSNGNIQWQKCLGGTSTDDAYSVQQTADGGYIVTGSAYSNDGDVTGNHSISLGYRDYWAVKLDGNGNIQWQKCLGGTGDDAAYSIQQTTDGGYMIAGYADSNNGDVTGNYGLQDFWAVKLDGNGNIQWQKCLGGTDYDWARSVEQTADGGFIIAGYTQSNNGDVTGNHGNWDYWVVKLDSTGNILWQKCLGGTGDDRATCVRQTTDGGYIVAGYTNSNDGDVTGNHGAYDYWVVKLDGSGNLQWQNCLGGASDDDAYSIQLIADGGYIVAGYTNSNDGDVTGNHGNWDYWVVKLTSSGTTQWQKCLGGASDDDAYSIQLTADGGYIVAGTTNSSDGDVTGFHNGIDCWVVKLSSFVGIEEESSNATYNIYPNPFTAKAVISFSRPLYNAAFSLYNLLGEKVSEAAGINGESFQFNRGNLQSGIYFFEVREKEKSIGRGKAVIY